MASKLPWTAWHGVVKLREDVRTGKLSLADFAADLHDVMMQKGARPIYEDPAQFFALTYPTFSLRDWLKTSFFDSRARTPRPFVSSN